MPKKFDTKIDVIVSGTTGSASIIQDFLKLEKIDNKNLIDPCVQRKRLFGKLRNAQINMLSGPLK